MSSLPLFGDPQWLLAFDFDGTLVNPDQNTQVESAFFDLLESLRKSHHAIWGINTGRSLGFTLQGLAEAKFLFSPDFIIARERDIFWRGDLEQWFPERCWNARSDDAHLEVFKRYHAFLLKSQKWVEMNTSAVWGAQEGEPESIISSTVEEMDSIVKWLDENMIACSEMSYQRNGIYLRFNHRDFNKGTSMAEVARIKKIPKSHRFAIGDSFNDLDMLDLKYVENLACPANACDEVKQTVLRQGGYVAKNHASSGTLEALKAVLTV